ncbi:MAG: hypothetical protein U0935_22545 [Pirellulales bacterium]
MLFQRDSFLRLHGVWATATLLITVAAFVAFRHEARLQGELPGGGSITGLVLGAFAALIILFEGALVVRRSTWLRARRRLCGVPLGSARLWLVAHIWLGLLTVPLVILHSGFRLGSPVTTWLSLVFAVVIASGVGGVTLQNVLPRILTDSIPEETIYSQIDHVGQQWAREAVELVRRYGGPGPPGLWTLFESPADESAGAETCIVGAPRRPDRPRWTRGAEEPVAPQPQDAPELHEALRCHVVPFLQTGRCAGEPFSSEQRLRWYFEDLRQRLALTLGPVVERLETLCRQRRQLNRQQRLHEVLHGWLACHLPLSAALLGLLVIHVVGALYYS